MDYPEAWSFVRGTDPKEHQSVCSWRTTSGAILCDCSVLSKEYQRRKKLKMRALKKQKRS